jgi:nucleotide-binding universal stress UspA family protein
MKVLIGVDDSAHAETTLEFVRKLAWPADTAMIVVSAVQLPFGAFSQTYTPVAVDIGVWLEQLTQLHNDLASRGARKLADAGLQAEMRVLQGDPRVALIEEATKERADLIVVGSHGRTGLEKLVMGSVASHVVTHAPCSVLVVRREAPGGRARAA